jgi:NAD(P)-dependent dehydrogenase (short-subunit alcohol dehydrogenase family)
LGAYGASKAAINHLAFTLATEEPLITSLAIRPGTVDTAMQKAIRDEHSDKMDEKDATKFRELHSSGKLLRPEQPGYVMARLVLDASRELSGKFLK